MFLSVISEAEDGAGRPGRPLLRATSSPLFLPPLFECFSIVLFNTFGKSSILVIDFFFERSTYRGAGIISSFIKSHMVHYKIFQCHNVFDVIYFFL